MSEPVHVRLATSEDGLNWDAYVVSHSCRSAYHLYGWRSFFENEMGKRCHYWLAEQNAQVVGVLPIAEMRSWLTGRFAVSLPYLNYGGALADSQEVYDQLLRAAADWARDTARLSHLELRETVNRAGLPARTDKVSMQLSLPGEQNPCFSHPHLSR